MEQLRRRWLPILAAALVLGGSLAWFAWPSSAAGAGSMLTARVKQGDFKVTVMATGELRARKFVQVTGPAGAQSAGVYQTKIASIIPEGTVVKTGDVIAVLDRQPAASKLADVTLNVQKAQADYTTAQLDSTLNLAQAREDVRTAEFALEEKKLLKEQAKYEAPTIQRQAAIDYEKAQRAWEQSKRNLSTKTKQAIAKMSSVAADLGRQQNQLQSIQQVMSEFTVRAPGPGMVIYVREWNGKKKGVGSQWTAWDPTVATLPDLTQMESQTYVNEVDVRKIAVGQKVNITLDADPTKQLSGTVTQIANVGEQRPNQDSKVFEVKIEVAGADTTLRPGMTTANQILTASVPNVLYVPLEAVFSEGGYQYVYRKDGGRIVRQMIDAGTMNDNEIVVRKGLAKDDVVYLSPPADTAGIRTERIDGLKPRAATPDTPATPTADSAKSVTVPVKPANAAPKAPAGFTPLARPKR
ncbi:MAG TPA: HlyD family efflux transporter periplasmic adaptor subunit [Gemmatimonadaceae bacterium]|nr:HlyD family efflux transporter periplasmic adaptor subunit [Gemmatimonadaceae bacterium]